ncbi:MAG: HAMP domain-containing sensor histidine kinase [Planctomycetota bacterium]
MDTHFAPPERASDDELIRQISCVSRHTLVNSMMQIVVGLFAVLNEQRQIIALNETFLQTLGIKDADAILGLRLGETLDCIHASQLPGGCGTSEYCSSCNAAIAMVTSLAEHKVVSRTCSVVVQKGKTKDDLFFRVSAYPMAVEDRRFLLLFLQDITHQQKWASLERAFFHDINNLVLGLLGASELISFADDKTRNDYAQRIIKQSMRLAKEVALQNSLVQGDAGTYQPIFHPVLTGRVLKELRESIAHHPTMKNGRLELSDRHDDRWITTDLSLLVRILTNMVINALEAGSEYDAVKVWTEFTDEAVIFNVWNRQAIPEKIQKRIFQRNYSTKSAEGRGIGTYIMKLFGEKYLKGKVLFSSSEEEGTVFSLYLDA